MNCIWDVCVNNRWYLDSPLGFGVCKECVFGVLFLTLHVYVLHFMSYFLVLQKSTHVSIKNETSYQCAMGIYIVSPYWKDLSMYRLSVLESSILKFSREDICKYVWFGVKWTTTLKRDVLTYWSSVIAHLDNIAVKQKVSHRQAIKTMDSLAIFLKNEPLQESFFCG